MVVQLYPRGPEPKFVGVRRGLNPKPTPLSLIFLKIYYIIYIVNEERKNKNGATRCLVRDWVCFPWWTANSGSLMELDEQPFY